MALKMSDIFFEDVISDTTIDVGPYLIPEQESIDFAAKWDPLPIHTDKSFAARHGGLTASGTYLMAVKMHLVHLLPLRRTVIASFGYDEVRFHQPAGPGDEVKLQLKWIEKRLSQSRTDRGIVTMRFSLLTSAGDLILSHLDTVLMRLRGAGQDRTSA